MPSRSSNFEVWVILLVWASCINTSFVFGKRMWKPGEKDTGWIHGSSIDSKHPENVKIHTDQNDIESQKTEEKGLWNEDHTDRGLRLRRSANHCLRYDKRRHKCTHCSYGYHGDRCQHQCSSRCQFGCYKENGNCRNCYPGSFGPQCQHHCPEHCGKTKGTLECNLKTGHCLDGCQRGFYGFRCESYCYNCQNFSCIHDDGVCQHGCQAGYYGQRCKMLCPQLCKNRTCNTEGDCSEGCYDGFKGRECDEPCPDNCAVCSQDGSACSRCKRNYTGSVCEISNDSVTVRQTLVTYFAPGLATLMYLL